MRQNIYVNESMITDQILLASINKEQTIKTSG